MAPLSMPQRILQILRLPHEKLKPLFAHRAWPWFWRGFTILSLVAVALGIYVAFKDLPTDTITVRPAFLILALGIYVLCVGMHLMGWHTLSRQMFGKIRLRDDIEALATSNLVKYLPTIVWYIANRAHYYQQRGVPQGRVVAASLYELGFMVSACASLLAVSWLATINLWLAGLALIAIAVTLGVLITRRVSSDESGGKVSISGLTVAFLWYAASWPSAGLLLWTILSAFIPIPLSDLQTVLHIWLFSSLASYGVSLTLGVLGFAREITLTVLLAQIWPLPVAITTSIAVKILLTVGEVTWSLIALGVFRLMAMRSSHE